jgi:hypothetical protein
MVIRHCCALFIRFVAASDIARSSLRHTKHASSSSKPKKPFRISKHEATPTLHVELSEHDDDDPSIQRAPCRLLYGAATPPLCSNCPFSSCPRFNVRIPGRGCSVQLLLWVVVVRHLYAASSLLFTIHLFSCRDLRSRTFFLHIKSPQINALMRALFCSADPMSIKVGWRTGRSWGLSITALKGACISAAHYFAACMRRVGTHLSMTCSYGKDVFSSVFKVLLRRAVETSNAPPQAQS